MATFKESSKREWATDANVATKEEIKIGSIQRIADAVEKIMLNYDQLINDRDRYKRWYEQEEAGRKELEHKLAGLRGYVSRLKKKS